MEIHKNHIEEELVDEDKKPLEFTAEELEKSTKLEDGQMLLDNEYQADEDHALGTFGGITAVISTMVGGGIVGVPYAFYQFGIIPATVFMLIMGILTVNSSWLYMKAMMLVPGKPESIFEIGYILFKRNSIFAFSGVLFANSFGICMVYFIIFGSTLGSFVGSFANKDIPEEE